MKLNKNIKKRKRINYVNCPSYRSLFFAIYLHDKGEKVVVVTLNNNVKRFCKKVGIDYIFLPKPINKSLNFLNLLFRFRRRVNDILNKINIQKSDRFYLLDNCFTLEGFYFVKKFSEKGEVLFSCLYDHVLPFKGGFSINWFMRVILKFIVKYVLDIKLIFRDVNSKPVLGINKDFLDTYGIHEVDIDYGKIKAKVVKKSSLKLEMHDNLFIDQGLLSLNILNKESVLNLYKNLFSMKIDLAIKEHPNFKTESNLYIEKVFYQDYVPVELIFGNIKKNIISIYSSSLISASEFKNIKAISLLELVEWKNKIYKQKTKQKLVKVAKNKIIFVKSFDELKRILSK